MEKVEKLARKAADKPYAISILAVAIAVYAANLTLTMEAAENTRISEHALMPGIVIPTFDKDIQQLKWLRNILTKIDMEDRAEYIANEMNIFLMDSWVQEWQIATPFNNSTGVITVSMLRAYRSSGAESMVVAARMEDAYAVAMTMALAYHSREQSYWSRDVLFLFVEGGEKGMDAWLKEYYGVKEDGEEREHLRGRGRFMVGAVIIETPDHLSREYAIDVRVIGMNGQLPNLDLFNCVARIGNGGRNQLGVIIYPHDETRVEGNSPLVPLRFMLSQALNGVEGMHSVFSKYGVQAVTIRGPRNRSGKLGRMEFVIEGVMRSLNNLHERLHQSYFLYVLISPGKFSSIAFYLPIIAPILIPLPIFALREWFSLQPFRPSTSLAFLVVYGIGCLLLIEPLAKLAHMNEEGMTRLIIGSLFLPIGLTIRIVSLPTARFIVLLFISLIIGSLSLINFPLSLLSSLLILPAVLITMASATTKLGAVTRTLLLFPFNPLALILLGKLAMISFEYDWWSHADSKLIEWVLLVGGPQYLLSTVYQLIDQFFALGSWQLPLLLIIAGPIWNSLLALASTVDQN